MKRSSPETPHPPSAKRTNAREAGRPRGAAGPDPSAAFARAAGIHRALGDEERIRLCALLSGGPCTVGELAARTRSALPTVSQRLKTLLTAGLVGRRRQGQKVFYSLVDDHVVELVRNTLVHADEDRRRRKAPRKGTEKRPTPPTPITRTFTARAAATSRSPTGATWTTSTTAISTTSTRDTSTSA